MKKMKKIIFLLAFVILLNSSLISSEMFINQVGEIYNLGDTLSTSATIKTTKNIEDIFNTYLICDGTEKKIFPTQYYFLVLIQKLLLQ